MHRVGCRVPDGRWKYFVRSTESFLIIQGALIRTQDPRDPPTLNLHSSPKAITNQPYPHQPDPALPNGESEEENREKHCERKTQHAECLTFFKKCNESLSRLIVPRAERKPENDLKVRR